MTKEVDGKIILARVKEVGQEKELALPRTGDAAKLREAGLTAERDDALTPHRPFKIIYATLYYDVRQTFVVDISEQFEARFAALMAYKSQFEDQQEGSGLFPARQDIHDRIHSIARFYGMLAGVKYAEPFLQKEVGLVEDLTLVPVKSI